MNTLLPYPTARKAAPDIYDPEYVKELFDEMSSSYEAVNYITSFGFSLRWRKQFIKTLTQTDQNIKVADFMTGLGENWSYLTRQWQNPEIEALDFSEGMLQIASEKNQKKYNGNIRIVNTNVLDNSLEDNSYDVIVCAFGLKTLNREQVKKLAREINRLLKPGGQYSFIEVSVPENHLLRMLYLFYLEKIIPLIGRLLRGNPRQYSMLGRYTRTFVNARQAFSAFQSAGLAPVYKKYFHGCATGFYGRKSN